MAKFKVVNPLASGTAAPTDFALEMEALEPIDAEVVVVAANTDEAFLAEARDADALLVGRGEISRTMIEGLERCKVISIGSVGTDRIDLAAATERGIPVSNVPDTFIEEVADHSMTLILAAHQRLTTLDKMCRDGRWSEGRPLLYQSPRLFGQSLGLISFGNVARAVALRAAPFGLRVLAFDPYLGELAMTRRGVEPVGLMELLERSDIVSMHAPGTAGTFHMMGEAQFRAMKPHAIFVNCGRGKTVDEGALVRALQERWIAAAGLDVFETEPPDPENPLLGMENVILTPHAASASARFDSERRRRVGREIALVLGGRWPMACVNPSVLEGSKLRQWKPHSME